MMQAARPRTLISPLQLGLGVMLHHQSCSRFVIDIMNAMGFCCSYSEVQRFEASAASSQNTDIPSLDNDVVLQYVADNVDHNTSTLDGKNTFHGMGIIATTTPGTKRANPIPRLQVTSKEVKETNTVPLSFYNSAADHFANVLYKEAEELRTVDSTKYLDLLWKVVWPIRPTRPLWSGFMQAVNKGAHPGKSGIFFLLMIDLNPSDYSCIFSTLLFVSQEAKRHGTIPVVTFDQPLYWKAQEIRANMPHHEDIKSIVLRLGAFHIEMSFLGAIGHLMEGTGIHDVLELAYASNAIPHMLQGKAISRAIRGHLLLDSALNALLVSKIFNIELPLPKITFQQNDIEIELCENEEIVDPDVLEAVALMEVQGTSSNEYQSQCGIQDETLAKAALLYDSLQRNTVTVEEICCNSTLCSIDQLMETLKAGLKVYPTASLWLQYMDQVDILRESLKAEKNWAMGASLGKC